MSKLLIFDDGGRVAAGFTGHANDCVCRAVAIVTGRPYIEVYREINAFSRAQENRRKHKLGRSSARNGVYRDTSRTYLLSHGFTWTPTMKIGSGCKVHLKADELPKGALIVQVSKHLTAVIDGVIYDTHDPSRGGTRAVYGYYTLKPESDWRTAHGHA